MYGLQIKEAQVQSQKSLQKHIEVCNFNLKETDKVIKTPLDNHNVIEKMTRKESSVNMVSRIIREKMSILDIIQKHIAERAINLKKKHNDFPFITSSDLKTE